MPDRNCNLGVREDRILFCPPVVDYDDYRVSHLSRRTDADLFQGSTRSDVDDVAGNGFTYQFQILLDHSPLAEEYQTS